MNAQGRIMRALQIRRAQAALESKTAHPITIDRYSFLNL
jgi:hypothetical protein